MSNETTARRISEDLERIRNLEANVRFWRANGDLRRIAHFEGLLAIAREQA